MARKIVLILVLLLAVAFVLFLFAHHGVMYERRDVTVRIVDRDTGQPLEDAVVALVCYASALEWEEDFERALKAGLNALEFWGDDSWRLAEVPCARTTESAETIVRGAAYVTRWWVVGPVVFSKEVGIPDVLLIDHPRFGRTIIPIDQESVPKEGDEPNTWRLDLGTVQLPR
ncbi:MAG: hypothetical protein O7C98_16850 [Planctomycetota bacterium]|nr:hypothetical protein [Planctomycetota bacterium]